MKIQLFAILLSSGAIYAQERTVSSGGELSSASGKISFTVGLPDYVQLTGTNGAISEGVQQPYELFVNAVEEWDLSVPIDVFPNPTSTSFFIRIGDSDKSDLSYEVLDFAGKLILSGKINELETQVDVSQLATASYLLNLKKGNDKVRSYKIIKN